MERKFFIPCRERDSYQKRHPSYSLCYVVFPPPYKNSSRHLFHYPKLFLEQLRDKKRFAGKNGLTSANLNVWEEWGSKILNVLTLPLSLSKLGILPSLILLWWPSDNFLRSSLGPMPLWHSLLEGRNLLSLGLHCRIGNGLKVHVWPYKWPSTPHFFRVSNYFLVGERRK